ncbi:MAG: gamma-glutamyltransferase [Methylococcales bacterium]
MRYLNNAGVVFQLITCFLFLSPAFAVTPPQAAIATAHPLATRAGFEVLEHGGNAFDAAVAISAALAVVEPIGSGFGGGGFWLLHRISDGKETMIDGRERAPLAAHRDMYLDSDGNAVPDLSINGPKASGIPGLPAALVHIAKNYGRLPLTQTLAAAVRYAREGYTVGDRYRRLVGFRRDVMRQFPASTKIFLQNGETPEQGFILKQPDLAKTLQRVAQYGKSGFYDGITAERLVAGVRAAGGIWTKKDLADYRIKERQPIRSQYRGINITSAAPPSSGGVVLTEALNILAQYDLKRVDSAIRKHLVIEAMRRAYHDRALYLGDPDFVEIPIERLLNIDYAAGLAATIRFDAALPSSSLSKFGTDAAEESHNTTHFSVLDREGNRVAATLSINYPFGSGFVVPGTGVLLNDEMDDFVSHPNQPNVYGLVGSDSNRIAPGKRMLSSMTPTFLEDKNRVAIVGTPGGSRIISMVLLSVLDFEEGKKPNDWVRTPRYHHQYLPDVIEYEPGAFSLKEIKQLAKKGHHFKMSKRGYGNMQAVLWDKAASKIYVASDPRGEGEAQVR